MSRPSPLRSRSFLIFVLLFIVTFPTQTTSEAPPSAACQANVAFTFTGHFRTFADPRVHESIVDNLVARVMGKNCLHKAYFFFLPNLSLEKGATDGEVAAFEVRPGKESLPDDSTRFTAQSDPRFRLNLAVIEEKFAPISASTIVRPYEATAVPTSSACPEHPKSSSYSQYMAFRAAYQLVDEFSQEHGVMFSHVIRCRFDVAYPVPLALSPQTLPTSSILVPSSHFPISDHLAVVPFSLAPAYFSVSDSLSICVTPGSLLSRVYSDEFGPNEAALLVHLTYHHDASVSRTNLPFAIVREGKGAECGRMESGREECSDMFTATPLPLPPFDYGVYSRGPESESSQPQTFTFDFAYHNPRYGSVENAKAPFTITVENYREKIAEFCGATRTDRGYIVPCHDFAKDVFATLEEYSRHQSSSMFVDNGFLQWLVPPSKMNAFYCDKADLLVAAAKQQLGSDKIEEGIEALKAKYDFYHDVVIDRSEPGAQDPILQQLKFGHTQPIPNTPASLRFPPLPPPIVRAAPKALQNNMSEEPFCVLVPGRSATDCIKFLRDEDPEEVVSTFCRNRTQGIWPKSYNLHVTLEDCVSVILPELKKKINEGNYIVDIEEEINLRRGIDVNYFFDRLNRIGVVEPTAWGGAGRGTKGIVEPGKTLEWESNVPDADYKATPGEVVFLQIGAHVGRTRFDPLFPYSYKHGWSGVLVEPVMANYAELVKNYYHPNASSFKDSGHPPHPYTVAFENAAVCDFSGEAEFEFVDPKFDPSFVTADSAEDEQSLSASEEYLYKGMGVSARGRLVAKNHGSPVQEFHGMELSRTTVRCITFEGLMEKHGVTNFKVLQIDAEGADLDVMRAVNFQRYTPMLVHFEHTGLSTEDKFASLRYMHSSKYLCELSTSADTVCVRVPEPRAGAAFPSFLMSGIEATKAGNPLDLVGVAKQVLLPVIYDAICAVRLASVPGDEDGESKCAAAKKAMIADSGSMTSLAMNLDGDEVVLEAPHGEHPSVATTAFCQRRILSAQDCSTLTEQVYLSWCADVYAKYWQMIQ